MTIRPAPMRELLSTPGPWIKDGLSVYALMDNGRFRNGQPAQTNRFYLKVQPAPAALLEGSMIEAEANAELISKAWLIPELLAVVKRTLSLFEAMAVDLDECARIRDLVERAEGKA